jgi:hypothetical protein
LRTGIGTRASRFLEELCRVYAFDDPAKLTKAFSIPKQALVWMQSMGSGEDKYLKRLAPAMAIAGCDMRYIEYGTRTYTREERTLIAELRQLPDSQRALAFYRLGQSMEQLHRRGARGHLICGRRTWGIAPPLQLGFATGQRVSLVATPLVASPDAALWVSC